MTFNIFQLRENARRAARTKSLLQLPHLCPISTVLTLNLIPHSEKSSYVNEREKKREREESLSTSSSTGARNCGPNRRSLSIRGAHRGEKFHRPMVIPRQQESPGAGRANGRLAAHTCASLDFHSLLIADLRSPRSRKIDGAAANQHE